MNIQIKKVIAREFLILLSAVVLGIIVYNSIFPYNYYQNQQKNRLTKKLLADRVVCDSLVLQFNTKELNQKWLFNKNLELSASYMLWEALDSLDIIPKNTAYDLFFQTYSISEAQMKLWNNIHSKDLYTKSLSDFKEQFFPKKQNLFNSNIHTLTSFWTFLDDLTKKDSIIVNELLNERIKNKLKMIGFNSPEDLIKFINRNRITKLDSANYKKAYPLQENIKNLENRVRKCEQKTISKNRQLDIGTYSLIFFVFIFFVLRYLFYSIKWSIRILKL